MKKPEYGRITRKCSKCEEPPFAHYRVEGEKELWWYECISCGERTEHHESKDEARAAWETLQSKK